MSKASTVSGIIHSIKEEEKWLDRVKNELPEITDRTAEVQLTRLLNKETTKIRALRVKLMEVRA